MKTLILKAGALLLMFILLIQAGAWLAFQAGLSLRWLNGREVYQALAEARRPSPARVVVFGDSVGRQLYAPHGKMRDDIRVLCSTAVISLAGQYRVLLEAARAGNLRGTEVVLICHPVSFEHDLQDQFTYQYFIKPFWLSANQDVLTPAVLARIQQVPWHAAVHLPSIRYGNWNPNWTEPPIQLGVRTTNYIHDVAAEYLRRIADLAHKEGFPIRIVAPPINQAWADRFYDAARFQAEIDELGFQNLFGAYAAEVPLRPPDWFIPNDIIHFRAARLQEMGSDPLGLLAPRTP